MIRMSHLDILIHCSFILSKIEQTPFFSMQTYIVLLHFALLRYCGFYKLKVYGNPESSQSNSTIFPTALLALCHILVIFEIAQSFSLLLYL